jgi:hypothetical protein
MVIENGIAKANMWVSKIDAIDYEEIHILCQKIYLDLPGEKDLVRAES